MAINENEKQEVLNKPYIPLFARDEEEDNYPFQNILQENKSIPFVDRIINPDKYPTPTLQDEQGRKQTHFMSADTNQDGEWIVYPKIIFENGQYKRVNMDQAIDSGNFINFGEDQKLATDFSANYKTKKFKDFYQEESSYVPLFDREEEETSQEETTEYIPLFNRQGFDKDTEKSFTSAFKFRGGSKVYDAGSEILYNLLKLPKKLYDQTKQEAIEDIKVDIQKSIDGKSQRNLAQDILAEGRGPIYQYLRSELEKDLGIDESKMPSFFRALQGKTQNEIMQDLNMREKSIEEKQKILNETNKIANQYLEESNKEYKQYRQSRQKLYKDRGYTEEEISLIGGVSSLVPSLTAFAASVFLRNPKIMYSTLPVFGALTKAEVYQSSRFKGNSHEDALINAYGQTISEVGTELLPLSVITKSLDRFIKGNRVTLPKLLAGGATTMVAEGTSEQINTFAQTGVNYFFDKQDELRLAVENSGDPFYEGPTPLEVLAENSYHTFIASLAAGGGMALANTGTQFAGMKIRDAELLSAIKDLGIEDGKSVFENMKILGMNYELEKAAIENASIRLTEEQETNPNVDPMDILAEELLKISYVGERISDESLEEGMDLDVIAENAEEGVTFINNILEDRGFDLDKIKPNILLNESGQPVYSYLGGTETVNIDIDNLNESADAVVQTLEAREDFDDFKKEIVDTDVPKDITYSFPQKPQAKTIRSLLIRKINPEYYQSTELKNAFGGNIPSTYKSAQSNITDIDMLQEYLTELGVLPPQQEGQPQAEYHNMIYDMILNNENVFGFDEKLAEFENNFDMELTRLIEDNIKITRNGIISKAKRRISTNQLDESLDRLTESGHLEKQTLPNGQAEYRLANPELNLTERQELDRVPEPPTVDGQPQTLQDLYENDPGIEEVNRYFQEALESNEPLDPFISNGVPDRFKPKRSKRKKKVDRKPQELPVDTMPVIHSEDLAKAKHAVENLVDKNKVVSEIVDEIMFEVGGQGIETTTPVSEISTYDGRVMDRLDNSIKDLNELFKKILLDGGTMGKVDDVLYYLHAPERNNKINQDIRNEIAELNKEIGLDKEPTKDQKTKLTKLQNRLAKLQDRGSGITTTEASRRLKKLGIEFDGTKEPEAKTDEGALLLELASQVRDYQKKTLDVLEEGSLVSQEDIADYRNEDNYKYYVPLVGFAADTNDQQVARTKSKGFFVEKNIIRKAKGRQSKASSPLVQIGLQRIKADINAEKNAVLKSFASMYQEGIDKGKWNLSEIYTIEDKEYVGKDKSVVSIPFKMDGQNKYLRIYEPRLSTALSNLGVENVNNLVGKMRGMVVYLSKMFTAYNPLFLPINFLKDVPTGLFNLYTESRIPGGRAEGQRIGFKTALNTMPRLAQYYKGLRGQQIKQPGIQELFDAFKKYGGQTGFVDFLNQDRILEGFERITSRVEEGEIKLNSAWEEGADPLVMSKKVLKDGFKATADIIYDLNTATENGVRFSAFVEYVKSQNNGSVFNAPEKVLKGGATLAKELTVNFNRKGNYTANLQSLYVFFNASIQGNVPLARALNTKRLKKIAEADVKAGRITEKEAKNKIYGPMKALLAKIPLMASAITLWNHASSDEDETGRPIYENLRDAYGDRFIIIMTGQKTPEGEITVEQPKSGVIGKVLPSAIKVGGKTIAFAYPKPWGIGFFYDLGRIPTELAADNIFGDGRGYGGETPLHDMGTLPLIYRVL